LKQPVVSIIMPTYNRTTIIGETLDSIIKQSYSNWECIIVDDGSTDNSFNLINSYVIKDNRFKLFKRPDINRKGANACRNIGLDNAKGDYIIFFDSDDLMTNDHIEVKVNEILISDCDYVITKTRYFNHDTANNGLEKNYGFFSEDISAYNYISQNINWLTLDVCIKAGIAKSVRFNELLQAGQEYNYFSKLLLISDNAKLVNRTVSLRRFHDSSIRGELRSHRLENYTSFYNTYWQTYLDVKSIANKKIRAHLVYRCTKLAYKITTKYLDNTSELYTALISEMGLKGVYHYLKLNFGVKA
jgi:glycosyltransferase involved in cell wall biosynthesis